jgi:four helix bundle protein
MTDYSHKNRNRGYRDLRVWHDAIAFYKLTVDEYRDFDGPLRRIHSQALASADSVHRNIAEGYCRRSVREYLNFINYALGSIGESVSGANAYLEAGQLGNDSFARLDELAFKLENGLLRLRDSLSQQDPEEWSDRRMIKESNAIYDA